MGEIAAGGEPLSDVVRKEFEADLSADLSGVRVHSMGAAEMAKAGDAKAFTQGAHIFFAAGAYDPHSANGKQLLAHELTHIVQQ
jgi:hypothetical protein